LINIVSAGFRKTINKNSTKLTPEKNDNPIPAGLPFAGAGEPLFINIASQIGVRLSRLKLTDDVPQFIVRDIFFPGKPVEPRVFENPHFLRVTQSTGGRKFAFGVLRQPGTKKAAPLRERLSRHHVA
jgi:hypothetical protein